MLIGPKIRPNIQKGDYHLVVNDRDESIKIYNDVGALVKINNKPSLPCMAKGVYGSTTWVNGGDTPPGLYKLGVLYVSKIWESKYGVWYPYGKYCYDMVEQENQENERGRAGICLHGGGSNAPDPLAPYQVLTPTHGCVRMHNAHIEDYILPLTHSTTLGILRRRKNTVWISVFQDIDR